MELPLCTAEQVLDTVEAVVVANGTADVAYISGFTQNSEAVCNNALAVGEALGLVENNAGAFKATRLAGHYFGTATEAIRIDLLRAFLEAFSPYAFFKTRLLLHGDSRRAAHETRTVHGITTHDEEVKQTLTNLGQYCGSLIYEAKQGLHVAETDDQQSYLASFDLLSRTVASIDDWLRTRLGHDAFTFIQNEQDEIITNLRAAVARFDESGAAGQVIQCVGNAMENFLVKVAAGRTPPIALTGPGVNAKVDELKRGGIIVTKHVAILKAVGHVRNAADHGNDPEINSQWTLLDESAKTIFLTALVGIKAVVSHLGGTHEI